MQLDIFEHSRNVILRNATIEALRQRDADASQSGEIQFELGPF